MNSNEKLLNAFYTAFANSDAETMSACYAPDVQFRDPVFGLLQHSDANLMWKMLLSRGKGNITIEFSNIEATDFVGSAQWIATYTFTKTKRKVVNVVQAQFQFNNGLISKHTDDFDLYKWAKQAFGFTGIVLGWTGFFQKKIQQQALVSLQQFKNKRS